MNRTPFKFVILAATLALLSACQTTKAPIENVHDELNSENYPHFKVVAYSELTNTWQRAWGYPTLNGAISRVLSECRPQDCRLYAVGNHIVFDLSDEDREAVLKKYSAAVLGQTGAQPIGVRMTGPEIREAFVGKSLLVQTSTGIEIIFKFLRNGKMAGIPVSVKNLPPNIANGDIGKWWVTVGKFCRRFDRWFNGTERCLDVRQDQGKFRLYYNDQLTATLKIKN